MVEIQQESSNNSPEAEGILSLVYAAKLNETRWAEITKWHQVEIKQLEKRLEDFETEEQMIEMLKWEYICLFFLICDVKGKEGKEEYIQMKQEFMLKCKNEYEDDYELYTYHVHGYLLPQIEQVSKSDQLKDGDVKIEFNEQRCKYKGQLDPDKNACGFGEFEDDKGDIWKGTFLDNRPHGLCKYTLV